MTTTPQHVSIKDSILLKRSDVVDAVNASPLEKHIDAKSLVDSLFWIPTKVWRTVAPLTPNPLPQGAGIQTECVYLNAIVCVSANQVSLFPPLIQFAVKADFRSKARINSTLLQDQVVSVFVYSLLKDVKKIAKLKINQKIVLKGFLRAGQNGEDLELHGASLVSQAELVDLNVTYSARGNSAPKNLHSLIFNSLQLSVADGVKVLQKRVGLSESSELLSLMNLGLGAIRFKTPEEFFWSLHLPVDDAHFEAAKQAARNIGVAEIRQLAAQASRRREHPDCVIPLDRARGNELVKKMGLKLTTDQIGAMRDIFADLTSKQGMRRLLSGDVGTGKTAVFAIFAAATQEVGGSVAICIPNGILAAQVYADIKHWFPHIPVHMVTASQKPTSEDLLSRPILIGTSALSNYWRVNINKPPNLLIVDEQQKSSREQREALLGEHTNFLECTATCLPRTMGLVSHGSLDITIINQSPVKKSITSKIIAGKEKSNILAEIKKLLAQGARCAIVLPTVEARVTGDTEQDEDNEKKSVISALRIWDKIFPGQVVGLHGKMKEQEKIQLLDRVKRGDFPIVLATSLIEIGVTIPNLRLVVVVHPEKYGASSLHQLRGRLVRNGGEGAFYMLINESDISEKSMARLNSVCATTNGFNLAEADFEARGFGDLGSEGSDQSGPPICLFKNIRIFPSDIERVTLHLQSAKVH